MPWLSNQQFYKAKFTQLIKIFIFLTPFKHKTINIPATEQDRAEIDEEKDTLITG